MKSGTVVPQSAALDRFEWIVRALSQDASTQLALFPEFVCVPDELVLTYDQSMREVLSIDADTDPRELQSSDYTELFDHAQFKAIVDLYLDIDLMSRLNDEDLWTDEALCHRAEWSQVRRRAALLVRLMNWPTGIPGFSTAIYVAAK